MIALATQLRLLFFLALAVLAVYVLRRLWLRGRGDPRLRYLLSGVGLQMLRIWLLRNGLTLLLRLVRSLRFFR